jgi:hypothetical protein
MARGELSAARLLPFALQQKRQKSAVRILVPYSVVVDVVAGANLS